MHQTTICRFSEVMLWGKGSIALQLLKQTVSGLNFTIPKKLLCVQLNSDGIVLSNRRADIGE